MSEAQKRAVYLMRVTAKYLQDRFPHGTIFYDEAECDSLCLSEDLTIAADDLES